MSVLQLRYFTVALVVLAFAAALSFSETGTAANNKKDKNCPECHKGIEKKLKGKYNHKPFSKKQCNDCHAFHGFENKVLLDGTITEVCTTCHETIAHLSDDQVHYPLQDEDACLSCHQPHSASNKQLLDVPQSELCLQCHDGPDETAAVVHKPFGDAACSQCHNPHGSPFTSFLRKPPGDVCVTCHTDIIKGKPAEMHTGTASNACEQCHDGHMSENRYLLKKPVEQLCIGCHDDLAEQMTEKKHAVLEDEDCLVCHFPHFQKGENFINEAEPDLCLACHSDIEERLEMESTHPAATDDNCTLCHNPHTSGLNDTQAKLCAGCHDMDELAALDAHLNRAPKNCTLCHNPHGSAEESLINSVSHPPYVDGDCDICHEDGSIPASPEVAEICLNCHDEPDPGDHPALADPGQNSCVICHSPHTSVREKLLRSDYREELRQ